MATIEEQNQAGFNYLIGKQFKVDTFTGGSKEEIAARDKFFHDWFHRRIVRGDPKDNRFTSAYDTFQWIGPTFDILYAKEVENGAKIDALSKAFTGALAAVVGGESFDQEKFLASVQAATAAGVQQGLAGLKVSGQLVDGRLDLEKEK